MKFGGIVGEVKISKDFDTSGATYSFTEIMSQNVKFACEYNMVHSFQASPI